MIKTLILEEKDYSKEALDRYRNLGELFFLSNLKKRQQQRILSEIEILVVRFKHKIDKNWLDRIPNLRFIVTNATGTNHIDIKEAKKRKIKIISLKGHTDFLEKIPSTAEETLALILALMRNIPWAFDDVKKGRWDRDVWKGHQLFGKKLALLGFGRLGKIMSRYGRALGMEVMSADPYVSKKIMKGFCVKKVDMKCLFQEADVLSVHVNLEDSTKGLIKNEHLKLMKKSAFFVNTSRGEIVDEEALLLLLKNKKIAGAALDVMQNEVGGKHLKNNILLEYAKKNKNLIIVPHIGGATYEALEATEKFVADLVCEYYNKK